jgi:hypothetical protein
MIGFYIMMIAVLALAGTAGYTIISSVQSSSALALGSRNAARLEQVADAMRQVVITDSSGGLFVPMGETWAPPENPGASRTVVPDWVSSTAVTPSGIPYGYCPYPLFNWQGGGTVVSGIDVRDSDGISYAVDIHSGSTVYGLPRDYVVGGPRQSDNAHPLNAGGAPQVLAFIISPTNNGTDVPPCDSIYWNGGAWLVSGSPAGSVRAITVDSLVDNLSAAPRILRRHVSPSGTGSGLRPAEASNIQTVIAEWRTLKPSRLVVEMGAGAYDVNFSTLDFGPGPGASAPDIETMGRVIDFVASGAVTIDDAGGPDSLAIPFDMSFDGIDFGQNAGIEVGSFARVLISDATIQSPVFVDGGRLFLSGVDVAPPAPADPIDPPIAPPILVESGDIILSDVDFLLADHPGVHAVDMKGGSIRFDGAVTAASAADDGLTPLLAPEATGRISHGAGASLSLDAIPQDLTELPEFIVGAMTASNITGGAGSLSLGLVEAVSDEATECLETGNQETCTAICAPQSFALSGSCTAASSVNMVLVGSAVTTDRAGFACTWQAIDFTGVTDPTPAPAIASPEAKALCAPIE